MVKEYQDSQLVLNQPAGHIENNESLAEAVIRETLEESGWEVQPVGLLGLYTFTPYEGADTYHRVCIVCDPVAHANNRLDSDIESSHWLTYEEIMAHPHRSPLVGKCIVDHRKNSTVPLSFISDEFLHPSS
ncbi:NUDIX domain-containing protein [Marinomonas sp. C2222]|uniref:NUDIX domain-containing protein n=1 Tax=Marinomonas sargassi TaxID=2984494 RepID=A0ABT2YN47_9GAMM|nr:NUDIX domain-containing protein [Marinomonas sargassi]MCV2401313.1 NUDIX domain-containing protein [Marinomonas sargassi]